MACIDVAKAYDSVDHGWLFEMFTLHRFPIWFAKVMEKLANSWNTRIVAQTTQGKEISPTIRFKKRLPQGDALCPMLFILCLNPIAWKVRATEGYRPILAIFFFLSLVPTHTRTNEILLSTHART